MPYANRYAPHPYKMVEKQLKLSNSFIRHYLSVNIGTKAMSIALFIGLNM